MNFQFIILFQCQTFFQKFALQIKTPGSEYTVKVEQAIRKRAADAYVEYVTANGR